MAPSDTIATKASGDAEAKVEIMLFRVSINLSLLR